MAELEQVYEDWYCLRKCDCTTPEGTAEEWREVIKAIREKGKFWAKRVAIYRCDWGGWEIGSPRNAYDTDDYYMLFDDQAEAFATMLETTLDANPSVMKDGFGI